MCRRFQVMELTLQWVAGSQLSASPACMIDLFQGIIGADPGNEFNISGVAYSASISAYRIFGCKGFVTDDGQLC